MPTSPLRPVPPARALVAAVLGGAVVLPALVGVAPTSGAAPGCGPGVSQPAASLSRLAADGAARTDRCGDVYVVDAATPAAQQAAVSPGAGAVPADVFALSSRPSSAHTLFLDFDGATYSGTRWDSGTIVSAPYSLDDDPAFSDAERAQVYLAWRSVAEDFAPFDVDVTTRQPSTDELVRSSRTDPTWGMPVVITDTNSVGARCGCAGVSYVGVMGAVDGQQYQPAWVFTDGSGTAGLDVGQVAAHEAGHTFGLAHDGAPGTAYYRGALGWAPIMGASYGARASQWSRGEYAGATTTEDDVATIAALAPVVPDDHADTVVGATPLQVGAPAAGTISTRADLDVFTFTAAGTTTVSAAGPASLSDLDVRLTVLDSTGATLAVVDPTATVASDASMRATWTGELPATPATYAVVVDGAGRGDPAQPGGYSDYASLGAYTIAVTAGAPTADVPADVVTQLPADAVTPAADTAPGTGEVVTPTRGQTGPAVGFVTRRLPPARAGHRYRAVIGFTGAVREARVDWRLPRGLRWRVRPAGVVVVGRVASAGTRRFRVELTAADGSAVRRTFTLRTR